MRRVSNLMMFRALPAFRLAALLALALPVAAQTATGAPAAQPDAAARPLPDVAALMRQVELNERKAEAVEKDYAYTTSSRLVEVDKNGAVKKTETRTYDIYWTDGVRVARLVSKNGQPLSPEEQKQEDDRLADAAAKARERRAKADAEGKETDSRGEAEIPLSRVLELGSFTHPRRVEINGRDTIAVDYTGDPKAKARNQAESALREMQGTVWVDEQDKAVQHLEGHFAHAYKVGGGLLINIGEGTWFKITNVRLNNEVWLPQSVEGHGHARILLFVNINGDLTARMSNYHKYRASTTILPGVRTVDPSQPDAGQPLPDTSAPLSPPGSAPPPPQ